MTLATAKRKLSQKLTFANPEQIKAHEFLLSVYECMDHIRTCAKCRNYVDCKLWPYDVELAARRELGQRPLLYYFPATAEQPSIGMFF
jgi:hypothetical protein